MIVTATNTVIATIPVGRALIGVAVTPDGARVYVANIDDNMVSVIATASNTVIATIPVGRGPLAFGKFIGGPSSGSPPVAVNETATTNANTPVTIDLTAGASGKPTSAALVGTPIGGTVSGFPATKVTFTPNKDFTGKASFQFTLANTKGKSNTATATITVKGVEPTAVNETATTVANVPAPIDLSKGASGSPTSAALVGTPVGGTVTGFPATKVTFTPNKDFTGKASFQFTLANAIGKSNTATATITVKGPDPNFKLSASAYCNPSPPVAPAVKLSWTAQGGTKFYDLYRNSELYSQNIAQTSFDNNANVVSGSAYAYFVVAHASAGDVESNLVSVAVPSGTCSPAALPDLVIQNLLLSRSSVAAGSNTVLKFIIHNKTPLNKGGLAAAPSVTHIRLSKSGDKVTVNDPLLLSLSTSAIAPEGDKTKADSVDVIEQVTIPNNQAAGSYYLWVILDSTSSAGQGPVNEQNDKVALPIVVTNPVAGPDLVVRNLNLNPAKISPGASTTVSFSIANQGLKTASVSTTKVILSTSNSDVSPTDLVLGSFSTPSLAPGQVLPKSASFTIPAGKPVGDYYLWVVLDANNSAGQTAAAKANDKAYQPLVLASDSGTVPLRYVKALGNTIKALKALRVHLAPVKLPDLLDEIKNQVENWKTIGEDINLLKTRDALLSSFQMVAKEDNSLAPEMDALEQRLNNLVATKLAIQGAVVIAKLGLDLSVDYMVGDYLQHKDWLPVAHSLADTFFYGTLAFLPAGQVQVFDVAWDQAILIWKETTGLDNDINNYIHSLVSSGSVDINAYWQAVTLSSSTKFADASRAERLKAFIASADAANQDNVDALWNQLSLTINSTKRPLVAWRIIQGLVHAREAEMLGHTEVANIYVSEVKSYVNWPTWVGVVLTGLRTQSLRQ